MNGVCGRCGGTMYILFSYRVWNFTTGRMDSVEKEVLCPICNGTGRTITVAPPQRLSRVQSFRKQYRLCRTRPLTRPLGVWHALRHAFVVAVST